MKKNKKSNTNNHPALELISKKFKEENLVLETILKEIKEIKAGVSNIKIRITNIEKCPTIQKELSTFDNKFINKKN